MTRLITRGSFTQAYAEKLVAAPEDREAVVRKLIESAGGKLIGFYFTTGETDFMLITEGTTEGIVAALLATATTGMISNVTTVQAWTGAEFKAVAEKAATLTKHYRPPGKK